MGNLDQLASMVPGMDAKALKGAQIDEKALAHQEAIIHAMTPQERAKPELINASRKKRVAAGSGTSVEEVNKLLKQFDSIQKMMKQFAGGKMPGMGRRGKFKLPF